MQEANSKMNPRNKRLKSSTHLDVIRQIIRESVRRFLQEHRLQLQVRLEDRYDDVARAVNALFIEILNLLHKYRRLEGQYGELKEKHQVLEAGCDAEVERRMKDAHRQHKKALGWQIDEVARLEGIARSLEDEKNNLVNKHHLTMRGLKHQYEEEQTRILTQHEEDKRYQQNLHDSELREKTEDHKSESTRLRQALVTEEEVHQAGILRMQQNFENRKKQLENNHNSHVSELEKGFATEVASIKSGFRATKSLLEGNLTKLEAKMAEMQLKHDSDKERIIKDFGDKIAEKGRFHKASLASMETGFKAERTRWETDRVKLQEKTKEAQIKHDSEKEKIKKDFEGKIAEKEKLHKKSLASMETGFKEERSRWENDRGKLQEKMKEMQRQHDSDKEEIRKDFRAQIADQENLHNASLASMETGFRAERSRWETERDALQDTMLVMKTEFGLEKEKMRRDFNTTVASLKSDFDKERVRLERERVEQQAALRKDVEYLNGELLARDPYTPLTDHELKSPFQGLGNEIDALSRLKWKSDQAEWPNNLLGRLSDNQRKVKKQLAQDIMWIILYEKIFCSPFRVFGEEGQSLELQWNEAYGKESHGEMEYYAWPKPTLESERWRYRTTTRLQEAVKQPASKWDPNSELKNEYNRSLESITKELSETLEKVSQLDQPTQQALGEIPKKAAEMWVEMVTQRCRIVVVLPGSNLKSQSDRVRKAREGGFELVIMPGLRRFGNSKGQDLDKVETISGASTIKLPSK